MTEPVHVLVTTPEKAVFDGVAKALIVPAEDGSLGILRDHVAMIGRVGSGLVVITQEHRVVSLFACGGFFMVSDNEVKLLVDRAYPPEEIDIQDAASRLAHAREMPGVTDAEFRKAYAARRHAEGEIRVATRAHC